MAVEVFLQLFNLFDSQQEASVDDTYAINTATNPAVRKLNGNAANPIVGGRYEDLIWAKRVNFDGEETSAPLQRNPNYGNTVGRYAPISGRFGFRLTF